MCCIAGVFTHAWAQRTGTTSGTQRTARHRRSWRQQQPRSGRCGQAGRREGSAPGRQAQRPPRLHATRPHRQQAQSLDRHGRELTAASALTACVVRGAAPPPRAPRARRTTPPPEADAGGKTRPPPARRPTVPTPSDKAGPRCRLPDGTRQHAGRHAHRWRGSPPQGLSCAWLFRACAYVSQRSMC